MAHRLAAPVAKCLPRGALHLLLGTGHGHKLFFKKCRRSDKEQLCPRKKAMPGLRGNQNPPGLAAVWKGGA